MPSVGSLLVEFLNTCSSGSTHAIGPATGESDESEVDFDFDTILDVDAVNLVLGVLDPASCSKYLSTSGLFARLLGVFSFAMTLLLVLPTLLIRQATTAF